MGEGELKVRIEEWQIMKGREQKERGERVGKSFKN